MEEQVKKSEQFHFNKQNEIDHIISNPPSWILRWGLTFLFLVTILFCFLAWMIKYPDVMSAKVVFVTENPAIQVLAQTSGKIEKLMIENNQPITKGQIIAVLENSAATDDVLVLKDILSKIENSNFSIANINEHLSLGELQNGYGSLVLKLKNYSHFSSQTAVTQRATSLQKRIENLKMLNSNISKQKATLRKEIELAKINYDRNLKLKEIGEISFADLEESQTDYLRNKRQSENFDNQILNNEVDIAELESQILDLREIRSTDDSDKQLSINEDLQRLKSEIAAWELKYIIQAPSNGKISFSKNWTTQQFINQNEELLTIVPSNASNKIIGRAYLPIEGSGKVEIGQTANIQLDGFPFREFGILISNVKSISLVPKDNFYLVELELKEGLKTTYDRSIPFRQEMQGTANIITENRRIVERIFDKLLNILKNT